MKYVIAIASAGQGSLVAAGCVYELVEIYDAAMNEVESFNDGCIVQIAEIEKIGKNRSILQVSKDYFMPAPFSPYVISVFEAKVHEYMNNNTRVKWTTSWHQNTGWAVRWGIVMKSDRNGTVDYSSACNRILAAEIMEGAIGVKVDNVAANHVNSGSYFIYQLVEQLIKKWRNQEQEKQTPEVDKQIESYKKYTNAKQRELCL